MIMLDQIYLIFFQILSIIFLNFLRVINFLFLLSYLYFQVSYNFVIKNQLFNFN